MKLPTNIKPLYIEQDFSGSRLHVSSALFTLVNIVWTPQCANSLADYQQSQKYVTWTRLVQTQINILTDKNIQPVAGWHPAKNIRFWWSSFSNIRGVITAGECNALLWREQYARSGETTCPAHCLNFSKRSQRPEALASISSLLFLARSSSLKGRENLCEDTITYTLYAAGSSVWTEHASRSMCACSNVPKMKSLTGNCTITIKI